MSKDKMPKCCLDRVTQMGHGGYVNEELYLEQEAYNRKIEMLDGVRPDAPVVVASAILEQKAYNKILDAPTCKLEGVGPDAPMVVNGKGGKQSLVKGRYDLLPPLSLITVAEILGVGAEKYGEDNWKSIDSRSHICHIIQHLLAHLAGDKQDDHLGHAACRGLMALEMSILEVSN